MLGRPIIFMLLHYLCNPFLFFHQPGSPKGPKGKKLTKAEKERLKKEEDEKKAKEEGNNRQTLMCLD